MHYIQIVATGKKTKNQNKKKSKKKSNSISSVSQQQISMKGVAQQIIVLDHYL